MSRMGVQPMDSLRHAEFIAPLACFICRVENNHGANRCRHCGAPMALAHQSSSQRVQPKLIAALGACGAGKTAYLGMLIDMLSQQNHRAQILARGAFSIDIQQATIAALRRCEFPEATPTGADEWNWIHCQIKPQGCRKMVELIMPDMSGRSLMDEVEQTGDFPVVRPLLKQCAGALIAIDASDVECGERDSGFQSMKLVNYLCELDRDRRKGWPSRPIAVIFTQADQVPKCFDDPPEFARQRLPSLWQLCHDRLTHCKFFATSVAGASATRWQFGHRVRVPLRIEPRGVVEPFEWLVDEMSKK